MLHVITVPSNLQSKGYLEVSKGYLEVSKGYLGVSGGIWGSGWKSRMPAKYVTPLTPLTPSKYPSTLWRYPTYPLFFHCSFFAEISNLKYPFITCNLISYVQYIIY